MNHNTAYLNGGLDGIYEEMAKGPISYSHYWAEPYFGYYRSDDEWIIRKHAQMLVNAGIDFVFFDTSNGFLYEHVFFKILKVYQQMRNEGQKTPEFVFFLGDREDFGKAKTEELYELVYKDGLFKDMWFMYNGKPLILANTTGVTDPEILNFFEIRRSWYNDGGLGKWSWLDHFPQTPGRNPITGEIEQISVGVAEHPSTSRGRSMVNGVQITTPEADFEFGLETTPFGLSFDEQWQIAHQYKAPILMICGWNELWAGRWEDEGPYFAGTYVVDASNPRTKNLYVDSFNPEYSRDIEPMKQPMGEGGFGDNYYYQTVQNIRKYKGARPVPKATGYAQISNFASFDTVQPEFRDSLYDTMHRDAMSFANKIHYTNTSGRNDIDIAKVCYDDSYWYFYVKCRENITEPEGENWMNLYIDADQRFATGWKGYDFLINRTSGQTASVEACNGNEYAWNQIGQGEIVRDGNQMYIKIDKSLLNLNPAGFDFKWADNSVKDGKVMEFMDQGDAAPDDRFNFRFEEKSALE